MKHLFAFLFFIALNASAQDILVRQGGGVEKVRVLEVTPTEVKYMKSEVATDSVFTELCSNLFYIRYQDGKLQTFNYEPKTEETKTPIEKDYAKRTALIEHIESDEMKVCKQLYSERHLYKAGDAIRRNTSCMLGSIGTSLASGACFAIAGLSDSGSANTPLFIAGGVTAAISLGLGIASIHYQYKSGCELRLSASEVIFKF